MMSLAFLVSRYRAGSLKDQYMVDSTGSSQRLPEINKGQGGQGRPSPDQSVNTRRPVMENPCGSTVNGWINQRYVLGPRCLNLI